MAYFEESNERSIVPLPYPLSEFRVALEAEIKAAKNNANSNAILLRGGQKVGQLASSYQYAFTADNVLNSPSDMPGFLVVDRESIPTTIVTVDGLRIVISIERDLGMFIPAARLVTDLTFLLHKLIQRIEANATTSNPAGKRMLNPTEDYNQPASLAGKMNLNAMQQLAVESALGRNLTFIWGPPGTGKTHTIGTIAELLSKSNRTAIIVSHTNTAVDQAIRHVAQSLQGELHKGCVLRVGQVKDKALVEKFPDVLLQTHVERGSEALYRRRTALEEDLKRASESLNIIRRKIAITEWLSTAESKIETATRELHEFQVREQEYQAALTQYSVLKNKQAELMQLRDRAARILADRTRLASLVEQRNSIERKLHDAQLSAEAKESAIVEQSKRLAILPRITQLRDELSALPSSNEQAATISTLRARLVETDKQLADTRIAIQNAITHLNVVERTGRIMRLMNGLPSPIRQREEIQRIRQQLSRLASEFSGRRTAHENATTKLARIYEIEGELDRYPHISTEQSEMSVLLRVQQEAMEFQRLVRSLKEELTRTRLEIASVSDDLVKRTESLEIDPADQYKSACAQLRKLIELPNRLETQLEDNRRLRKTINTNLFAMFDSLMAWKMLDSIPETIEERLEVLSVRLRHLQLYSKVFSASLDRQLLDAQAEDLESQIRHIGREITVINEGLAQVEKEVIAAAKIVGASLTKAYLSDELHARKFDTVILDEASMAAIPALWVAALLSSNNLVIVGDFRQLPPIVIAESNDSAKKWLGRDIFEVSGLKNCWENDQAPNFFLPLQEQRRMLPDIAEVANLFYNNFLTTPLQQNQGYAEYLESEDGSWTFESPVLLVNTGTLNAWVTSVPGSGRHPSRLNFLSATVSVDLATMFLPQIDSTEAEGESKRILIISPYKPHARLVNLLIEDNEDIAEQVIAGTVHSFQGSEAELVIFDLVADEPHWRLMLFNPKFDEGIKRLLNVALTRAKFRLVVLADFEYCKGLSKRAFLGGTLIPFLLNRFPCIDASALVPEGFSARSARAQRIVTEDVYVPASGRILATQTGFFAVLRNDIERATNRIVIYSPFITLNGVRRIVTFLGAAVERGVRVFIVTKSHYDRKKNERKAIHNLEAQLHDVGVVVVHKKGMHEKVLLIDNDIVWTGSLNALSFSEDQATQEIMERRTSSDVFALYVEILRLEDLIGPWAGNSSQSTCPICNCEMIAAEGSFDGQPYHWRCINDKCFKRSIDQPHPTDGRIACAVKNCHAAVKFGYWGDRPHWLCTANSRHRQRILKSHLKLPKMRELVPQPAIDAILGCDTGNAAQSISRGLSQHHGMNSQLGLFEEDPAFEDEMD